MARIPIRLWNESEGSQESPDYSYDCHVSVGVDERGLTTSESHISINRSWLASLVTGDLDQLIREIGLERSLADGSRDSEQLRFDLGRALELVESSLAGGGASTDAHRVRNALHGLLQGLTVVVENRLKGFLIVQEASDEVTQLSQAGRYTGPRSPEYTFKLNIFRDQPIREFHA